MDIKEFATKKIITKKTARVLITTECNLKCEYCCNKLPEIQNGFKMTTFDQFVKMDYETVNISGGEPMLVVDKLENLAHELNKKEHSPNIYIYTNGFNYPNDIKGIARMIDGVNIGCHESFEKSFLKAMSWQYHINNIRFHIEKGKLTKDQREILLENGFGIKEWVMNECDGISEDRWII